MKQKKDKKASKNKKDPEKRKKRKSVEKVILKSRERFHREGVARIRILAFGLLVLFAILFALTTILLMRDPAPAFFSGRESDRGLVLRIDVSDGDEITDAELITWVGARLVEMFNFSYADADSRFRVFQRHLSPVAWRGLEGQIESEGYNRIINREVQMRRLDRDRLIVTAVPRAPPLIESFGVGEDGHYYWDMRVPMVIRVNGPPQMVNNDLELFLRIRIVPYAEMRGGRIFVRDDPLEIARIGYLSQVR